MKQTGHVKNGSGKWRGKPIPITSTHFFNVFYIILVIFVIHCLKQNLSFPPIVSKVNVFNNFSKYRGTYYSYKNITQISSKYVLKKLF